MPHIYNNQNRRNCNTCDRKAIPNLRKQNMTKVVEHNVVKKREDSVCMGCFRAGKTHACKQKKLGKHNIAY